jgi:hypothetical protein
MRPVAKTAGATTAPQARLILQDPLVFDQSIQPALRSSTELTMEPAVAGMEREKARDLWESLSLEPDVAQERQSERKRLLLRADNLARESAVAKAQALDLQTQLAKAHDERLHHPLFYAGTAGLLGLGALWLLERRKRIALQERELEMLAQQSPPLLHDTNAKPSADFRSHDSHNFPHQENSIFSLEDSPDLAHDFATDLHGLPESDFQRVSKATEPNAMPVSGSMLGVNSDPVLGLTIGQPAKDTQPSHLQNIAVGGSTTPNRTPSKDEVGSAGDGLQDMSWKKPERGLLSMSKRVLGHMLRGRSDSHALTPSVSAHSQTEVLSSSLHSTGAPSSLLRSQLDDATQELYDEEAQEAFEQELLAQQLNANLHQGYVANQSDIDLLSLARVPPQHGESVMEHILELRTAVNGLCALGRPEDAAKLLEEHIAADPSTCAWAYLEYMHVCEQIGWREEFEVMRKSYRQQFNRMAPYWHEPNSNVLGLDGYARAAGELSAAWAQGISHSQHTLTTWLVGPHLGRKLVQLPAYHDLFDLYELLEFVVADSSAKEGEFSDVPKGSAALAGLLDLNAQPVLKEDADSEQEFVPTVSLLDLDYEFSSDVTLEESEVQQSEKAVTIVKTGNFSVDFNVAGTQLGAITSRPIDLAKK